MKNLSLIFMALWAATLSVSAQKNNVFVGKGLVYEGRIVNESGIPIKDAIIKAINKNISDTTEYDGSFSLTLPIEGDSIVITKEGLAIFSRGVDTCTVRKTKELIEIGGKMVEKNVEIVEPPLLSERVIRMKNGFMDYYEYKKKEVVVLGPLTASRMPVVAYAKKMSETATKYFDAGLKFLSDETPDYMKAFACFNRAANMENDQAAYQLAKMYDEGRGIPQDYIKAFKWYQKASGILGVPLRIAVMYMEGIGTKQNDIIARNWLYRAISAGDSTEAPKLLEKLYAKHAEEMGDSDSDRVYEIAETNAQFPGGDTECYKFLNSHVKYPPKCQEKGIQGRVLVSFVVNKDGSIVDIKTLRSPDPLLTKEAERVISLMPKWIPAMQGWKNVRSRFTLPIMFNLR